MEKRRALGRGLEALIPEIESGLQKQEISQLSVDEIFPGRYQPREDFNQEKLNELITSIKEKGVVQPLLVRRADTGYELIAGERRLRAVKTLGIEKVPVIIKQATDQQALEIALIENIQREELNPIEEAHAYKRLTDEFGFSQDKISQAVGKDRSSIANTLRLLNLPLEIQRHLSHGEISAGHAKAILSAHGLQQQLNMCGQIIKKGLSVREAEALANPRPGRRKLTKDKDQRILEQEEILQHALATKVRIETAKKRGKIIIEYYSIEDLGRIINKISS